MLFKQENRDEMYLLSWRLYQEREGEKCAEIPVQHAIKHNKRDIIKHVFRRRNTKRCTA
jgi:hypothetical protein